MFDSIRKVYVRSFTWDTGISALPKIRSIVILNNSIIKPKSKRAKRRAMAKARAA